MALSNYQILEAIRDQCATLPGIETCQIGIETPIVPDAYPILRVVLSEMQELDDTAPGRTMMSLIVYYGESVRPLSEGGLESQHEWLLDMEALIKRAIVPGQGWRARWVETVWDEDRVPGFKLFASRFEVWA
jgi:hypothetical protein